MCVCVRACVHARARVCASGMMGSRFVNGCFSHAKRGGQGPAEPSDRERERRCLGLSLKSRSSPGLFCLQSQQGPLGTDPFVLSVSLSLFLSLSLSRSLSLSLFPSLSLSLTRLLWTKGWMLKMRLLVRNQRKCSQTQNPVNPSSSLSYAPLYVDISVSGLCFMIYYIWIYVCQGSAL